MTLRAVVDGILKAGLSNKHRHIKNSSLEFWNSSFGANKFPLEYPDYLLPTLQSLKEKVNSSLSLLKSTREQRFICRTGTLPQPLQSMEATVATYKHQCTSKAEVLQEASTQMTNPW
jgi:hypothetical protein